MRNISTLKHILAAQDGLTTLPWQLSMPALVYPPMYIAISCVRPIVSKDYKKIKKESCDGLNSGKLQNWVCNEPVVVYVFSILIAEIEI